jgi:drug/metabolite transporter (DMT)-like permease
MAGTARGRAGVDRSTHGPGLGPRIWAALAVVYVVWGSTYLAIRFTVETVPPLLHAGVRFALAGLLLGAGGAALRSRAAVRSSWRLTPAQFGTAAGSGVLLLTGGNGLVSVGEQRVPSGLAALIVASVPLWIVVLRAVLRDRPATVTALGVLVGFTGVALLFLPGGGGNIDTRYCALIVLASLSWSIGSLLVARLPVPADPVVLSSVQMLAGGAALFAISAGRGELSGFHLGQVSTKSWLALAYLVVFGSIVAFTAFGWLLGQAPVSVVATYAYVNPAVAVLLGALFAGERLTGAAAGGGLLILLAVALVVTAEGRARRRAWLADHPDGTAAGDLAA